MYTLGETWREKATSVRHASPALGPRALRGVSAGYVSPRVYSRLYTVEKPSDDNAIDLFLPFRKFRQIAKPISIPLTCDLCPLPFDLICFSFFLYVFLVVPYSEIQFGNFYLKTSNKKKTTAARTRTSSCSRLDYCLINI